MSHNIVESKQDALQLEQNRSLQSLSAEETRLIEGGRWYTSGHWMRVQVNPRLFLGIVQMSG